MKRALLALLLVAAPAAAQVTAPTYSSPGGNTLVAQGVVMLNADGTSGGARATSTLSPGVVAAGGAYQSVLAASATRRGCAIYNKSAEVMQLFLGAPASGTAALSIPVPAGGSFNCGSFQGLVLTDQISLTAPTTGSAYLVVSQ